MRSSKVMGRGVFPFLKSSMRRLPSRKRACVSRKRNRISTSPSPPSKKYGRQSICTGAGERKMKISRTMLIIGALIAVGAGVYAFAPSKSAAPATKEAAAGKEEGHGAEGVEMSDAKVAAAGIEVVAASKGTLRDALQLNGILQPNQEALVQVTPRFPGVVREIKKRIGDQDEKGELLAKIESNQSLTVYEMRAPIAGTVIDRQISLGEYASEQKPAFTVADISTVWVDLSVYRRDLPRVKLGDTVLIDIGDGRKADRSQAFLHLAHRQ